jgi:hypothetical protein
MRRRAVLAPVAATALAGAGLLLAPSTAGAVGAAASSAGAAVPAM